VSTDNNTALVLKLYQNFDNGSLDGFADSISSDFVADVLGTTKLDWTGFKQFAGAFTSAFPDGRHVFEHVVTDGDTVVTVGTYQGTQTGEIHGISPTNKRLKLSVMHLDRVVNGKVVEHRGIANEADFLRQLGAFPT
jgi:predicted ester cyclase